jgi:transcription initiation factor TFIIH subunit 1
MLRAHAIERTQQRGPYNVLSVLKPKTQDGTTKVSLSADRIRDIFEQHPLIKRVYDENVPKVRYS